MKLTKRDPKIEVTWSCLDCSADGEGLAGAQSHVTELDHDVQVEKVHSYRLTGLNAAEPLTERHQALSESLVAWVGENPGATAREAATGLRAPYADVAYLRDRLEATGCLRVERAKTGGPGQPKLIMFAD